MQALLWAATGDLPGGSAGVVEEGRSCESWVELVLERRNGEPTRSSCSLRSAALQDCGSAQAQEEVRHKKERKLRWQILEEWKGTCFKSSLMIKLHFGVSFVIKRRRCSGDKVEGTEVGEQMCSSLMSASP